MKIKTGSLLSGFIASVILFSIDQITKILAKIYLSGTPGLSVIPGVFEFFYLENRGAAFGMMENRQLFFILVAIVMFLFAGYVYIKLPASRFYTPLRIICVFIAAGAAGNMTDRIIWNYVIDFLYVSLIDFPVFNIADIAITLSTALLMIMTVTGKIEATTGEEHG